MSIDGQVELGVDVVGELGWVLVRTYDDGGSASRFARKRRKDWEQLVKDLGAGRIDVLILNEVSRGDRKAGAWLTVLDACRERGVLVHVISDDTTYDPRKVRQWKALADAGIDADAESSRTSEQVTRGVARAAKRGHPPMGVTPYGYVRHRHSERDADGRLTTIVDQVPDPDAAKVIQRMFELVARSVPLNQVMRDLRNKFGVEWVRTRLNDAIRNPAYIGKRVHRRQGRHGNRRHPELFDGNWEALVDEETYWAAQRILDNPERASWPGRQRPGAQRHLASHLATCENGHPVTAKKDRWYRCAPGCVQILKDPVDEFVTAVVLKSLRSPEIYSHLRATGSNSDAEVQAARDRVAKLRARLDDYRARARAGTIDADDFAEIAAGLRTDIAVAKRDADAIGLPPAIRPYLEAGADVDKRWYDDTIQAQREIVRMLYVVTLRSVGGRKNVPVDQRVDMTPRVPG